MFTLFFKILKLFLAKPIRAGQHNIIGSNRINEEKRKTSTIPGW